MIKPGAVLQQRYRIDRQIGQGGMGAVYIATDERFGSTVAIKETLTMDDNFRKAIEREARLLNSLKHPALTRVTDHFEEENSQFLVMEYVPGEDLSAIIERENKPFPVDQVLDWADQLLDALDFLHTQDTPVVHRDIKPQNLKLTPKGRIVLLDFGLAKGNPTDAGHQTAAKSIFGYSRNYASLEQIQGTGTDPRSDLYSLGATLYHLMTGVPPEDALTRAMSVVGRHADPLRPASSLSDMVPAGVAGVLHKALDLNASDRPASASEMRQMLREPEAYAHLAGTASTSVNATDARVFAQPTRLMPEGTMAMGNVQTDIKTEVMPSGAVSEATSVRTGEASSLKAADTASPVRRKSGLLAGAAAGLLLVGGAAAGGLFLVRPELFGTTAPAAATVANDADPSPALTQAAPEPQPTAAAEQPSNSVAAAVPSSAAVKKTDQQAAKPSSNPKPDTAAEGATTEFTDDDGEKVTVVEKPNETVLTTRDQNGEVTTMRIPRQPGVKPPNAPRTFDPFPNGFDPGQMTPEQRRRLREALQKARRAQPGVVRPEPPPNND